jgi:hypothetical protein
MSTFHLDFERASGWAASSGAGQGVIAMQTAVQDRILIAVGGPGTLCEDAVLAACPRGADWRDYQEAMKALIMDNAITGQPFVLTSEGHRRLTVFRYGRHSSR